MKHLRYLSLFSIVIALPVQAQAYDAAKCYLELSVKEKLSAGSKISWTFTDATAVSKASNETMKGMQPGFAFLLNPDFSINREYIGGGTLISEPTAPSPQYQIRRAFAAPIKTVIFSYHSETPIITPVQNYKILISRPDLYDALILQDKENVRTEVKIGGEKIVPKEHLCGQEGVTSVSSLPQHERTDFMTYGLDVKVTITPPGSPGANPIPHPGCTDPSSASFDSLANVDDGSCTLEIEQGCTDERATNYSVEASEDDGSCVYKSGCTDEAAENYDSESGVDDGSCSILIWGCTDFGAPKL
jgi:hypothetical protein